MVGQCAEARLREWESGALAFSQVPAGQAGGSEKKKVVQSSGGQVNKTPVLSLSVPLLAR